MKAKVLLDYEINDKVCIKELERPGRVVSVWVTCTGVKYEVRYFQEGNAKTVYFFGDELEEAK